jgi:hypothetical protein
MFARGPEAAGPRSLTRGVAVAITRAAPDRLTALASVLDRSFVVEPMMCWSLGYHGDLTERLTRCFEYFLEGLCPRLDRLGYVRRAAVALLGVALRVADPRERIRDCAASSRSAPESKRRGRRRRTPSGFSRLGFTRQRIPGCGRTQ